MTNDEAKICYCFAVKNELELYSSEWLKNKKAAIVNDDNCFQNDVNDSLDYQKIKKDPEVISNIKPFINQYNWKRIEFQSNQKSRKSLKKTINKFFLVYYMYNTILNKYDLHINQNVKNVTTSVKIK